MAGQEAGSRAAPSFSAHSEIYKQDLMPVGWYQCCGMEGLREGVSPTAGKSVLLLRAYMRIGLVVLARGCFVPSCTSPGLVVQFLCCPQGQFELQELVQLVK